MKIYLLAFLMILPAIAVAQEKEAEEFSGLRLPVIWGYKFAGWDNQAVHNIAFGLGYVFRSGLGFDIEIGTHRDIYWDKESECFSSVAIHGSYNFHLNGGANTPSKFEPFVTAGYIFMSPTLLGSSRSPHLLNAGGGLNYWLMPGLAALRVEFWEYISFTRETSHASEIRTGVVLRLP